MTKNAHTVPTPDPPADRNEVLLSGRVSAPPRASVLPSGDEVITFRLVVARPRVPRSRTLVDTIDVSCWTGRSRQAARRLSDGDHVEVTGSLHRRFFRTGGGPASRYEVAAEAVTRTSRPRPRARAAAP